MMSDKESPINSGEFQYVVGIDFGTTFSGAGYVFINNADVDNINDIRQWPKNSGSKYLKVPTVIRYDNNNPDVYKCGAEALNLRPAAGRNYGPVIRLFKLLLDPYSANVPRLPEGLDLVKVISDYLRDLHANIIKEMMSALGDKKKIATIRYCLTVPAIWDDEAKTIMREAAIQAGIISQDDHPDRLLLIGEPEAAALYAEKMRGGIQINSDETILICDAGGGTIDITTYQKFIEGENRSFKQMTISIGNTFGSTQLDNLFRNYVWRMIEREVGPFPSNTKEEVLDAFEKYFVDNIKTIFFDHKTGDGPGEPFYLEVPHQLPEMFIIKNGFEMKREELVISYEAIEEEVFHPVVSEVLDLIEDQLLQLKMHTATLDYIILVGGFGQSAYLEQKVKERFQGMVGRSIITPSVGELAVTRGAVLFGLDPYSITHRKMKITYGFGISALFEDGVDRADFRVVDKENKAVCKNRFDPCVRKGQDVSLKDSVKKVYHTFNSNTCHLKLYGFKGDTIPRYVSDDPDAAKKGEMAYKVADFVLELPERFKDKKGKAIFNIEVFFGHMEIRVVVKVPDADEKLTFMAYYESESNSMLDRKNGQFRPTR